MNLEFNDSEFDLLEKIVENHVKQEAYSNNYVNYSSNALRTLHDKIRSVYKVRN